MIERKTISNFPNYYILNDGKVWSKINKIFLKPFLNGCGRLRVRLSNDLGDIRVFQIARLVAIHFVPNPDNLPIVNHEDGNKLNNRWWNLKWCTQSYNNDHARVTGLNPGASKLTISQKRRIGLELIKLKQGDKCKGYKRLAKKYGVSKRTISRLL